MIIHYAKRYPGGAMLAVGSWFLFDAYCWLWIVGQISGHDVDFDRTLATDGLLAFLYQRVGIPRMLVFAAGSLVGGVAFALAGIWTMAKAPQVPWTEDPLVTDPFQRKLEALIANRRMPTALAKELLAAHVAALQSPRS